MTRLTAKLDKHKFEPLIEEITQTIEQNTHIGLCHNTIIALSVFSYHFIMTQPVIDGKTGCELLGELIKAKTGKETHPSCMLNVFLQFMKDGQRKPLI